MDVNNDLIDVMLLKIDISCNVQKSLTINKQIRIRISSKYYHEYTKYNW